jgi:hypothetical protein
MADEIRLRFTYNEKEYAAAVRLWYARTMHVKLDVALGVLLLAIGIWFHFHDRQDIVWPLTMFGGALLLILIFTAYFIIPKMRFRQEPKLRDEHDLSFTDEGIHFKTVHIDSRLDWNLYRDVWEHPAMYLLIYGKAMFTVIPKRVFEDAAQEALFRELLTRHIKPLGRKLRTAG